MTLQKLEIPKLFDKKPPSKKTLILWLAGFTIVLLVGLLMSLGMFSTTKVNIEWEQDGKKNFIIFLLSFFIGLIGNLLASVVYELINRKYFESQEADKIKNIESLGDKRLLIDIFNELMYYDNRHCEDYFVNAKLKKHPTLNNFFICEVKFHYKKILNTKDLVFQFVRITKESDINKIDSNKIPLAENYLKNEFYHIFDERGFPSMKDKDIVYKLNYLEVLTDGERATRLTTKETKENNTIKYEANLGSHISLESKLVTIDYEVEFMMEQESHASFSIELPTKNIRFEFDYSEVYNHIDLYAYDFLSSHRGPVTMHSLNETKIRLLKEDWILPKSSFLFIWYKKETKAQTNTN
jgi:hypothetical protein